MPGYGSKRATSNRWRSIACMRLENEEMLVRSAARSIFITCDEEVITVCNRDYLGDALQRCEPVESFLQKTASVRQFDEGFGMSFA